MHLEEEEVAAEEDYDYDDDGRERKWEIKYKGKIDA
jgi:hypothetical protein